MADDSRPHMYLFGCTLKSDKREFRVEAEDDEADHQLSLKAVCVGAEAEDQLHVVEVEGGAYDGKTTRVPLAALRPSVLPSMSLGGFEVTPPITFRLQAGCGPVYISGQHFVSVKDSEDSEEENNTSPVKRPTPLTSGKQLAPKKLKLESDEDEEEDEDDSEEEDEDEDDDDDDDDDSDEDVKKSATPKPAKKIPEVKKVPFASKHNGSPGKPGSSPGKPGSSPGKPGSSSGKPGSSSGKPGPSSGKPGPSSGKPGPSSAKPQAKIPAADLTEIKSRLATHAKEGRPFPRTEQKFENFARSSYKISDKTVIKDLWKYTQTLKRQKK